MINREFTVYGNGKHFKNKILPTLSKFKSVKIKSIISRNKNQCIENSSIKNLNNKDCINYAYISTPISAHYKNILNVINNKNIKVIICEKTLTNNLEKTNSVIIKCKNNKILLLESYMYQYHPQFSKLKKIVKGIQKKNKNGTIYCRYTIPSLDKYDHRNNVKLTGGIINEIGCYPLSILYLLFDIDVEKLRKIKIINKYSKNKKKLIYFKIKNLNFILSWGYNSNYRNRIIYKTDNKTIIANKFFGKRNEDIINIEYLNKKNFIKYNFKNSDNFMYMFKHFFSLQNSFKNRSYYFREIKKIYEVIEYFKS